MTYKLPPDLEKIAGLIEDGKPYFVKKPWGSEEWIALNEHYCYKRLCINAGQRTSFQYHNEKSETLFFSEGTAEVWLEDAEGTIQKKRYDPGFFFNIRPLQKHRVVAITDLVYYEVSTSQLNDIVRLADDWNRTGNETKP